MTSSRATKKATYDNLAFRYLSADQHPDHDTIARFRQKHLEALAGLFVQVLRLCSKAGLIKLGTNLLRCVHGRDVCQGNNLALSLTVSGARGRLRSRPADSQKD